MVRPLPWAVIDNDSQWLVKTNTDASGMIDGRDVELGEADPTRIREA
jgi:hypothetical protein